MIENIPVLVNHRNKLIDEVWHFPKMWGNIRSRAAGLRLLCNAGVDATSSSAPRLLWPGAGTGPGGAYLLRAHLLLDGAVLDGKGFAHNLAHSSIEVELSPWPIGQNCVSFLEPLIESWRIDLTTFDLEIVLNRRLASPDARRFEFSAREPDRPSEPNPGLEEFLRDPSLSGDATKDEIEFLSNLRLDGRRPTPLYYYRELQNLRDPLNFRPPGPRRRSP
jgi:hypothetical protein